MRYNPLPSDPHADGLCASPVCGAAYSIADIPCAHFVGDWCFTADHGRANPRGQWATATGQAVLVAFDTAVEELNDLLENREWRSEKERRRIRASLPKQLREAIEGWSSLLDARIVAAPGYLGTHEVETESMAGDAWSVDWAEDGVAAAQAVELLFREDLARLEAALAQAREGVLPE